MKMKSWSMSKRIGWWFFVAWTLLVTLIVGWGTPLFAMPSAGQLTLILELTAFGFIVAFGISVGIEAWIRAMRVHC